MHLRALGAHKANKPPIVHPAQSGDYPVFRKPEVPPLVEQVQVIIGQ